MDEDGIQNNRILITVPINKSYYLTFVNSLVPIHFFNDTQFTIESLKNLLFPPEHLDKEFNDLVSFIKIVFDEIIRNNIETEALRKYLSLNYSFEDDVLNSIINIVLTKRIEILNQLNSRFYDQTYFYKNLHWSIKSILSASDENHFVERYSDLELVYIKNDNSNLEHKNLTLTKNDFDNLFSELKKIKDNLKMINSVK